MSTFRVDARYARLVRAAIAIALDDAARDKKRRAEGRLASVPDNLVDHEERGEFVITVDRLVTPITGTESDDEAEGGQYAKLLSASPEFEAEVAAIVKQREGDERLPWERDDAPKSGAKLARALRISK